MRVSRELKNQITEIVMSIIYNEMYPIEPYYETAEYINGREERTRKLYLMVDKIMPSVSNIFNHKVNTASALIIKAISEAKETQ